MKIIVQFCHLSGEDVSCMKIIVQFCHLSGED
ncbi:hypothetical protein EDF88_4694, partial [Buttiauxella sp. BIGb0552]